MATKPKDDKPTLEDTLKAGADGTAPQVSVTFIDTVNQFKDVADLAVIEDLIRQGALEHLDLHLPWNAFQRSLQLGMGENYIRGIVRGADLAASYSARAIHQAIGTQPVLTFDATNPRVHSWIRTNTARLVTQVTDETRNAIRDVVVRAMKEELPPLEINRGIRAVIGLNRPQGQALENYRRGLIANRVPRGEVTRLTESRQRDMLNYRAEMIARTEMMNAVNQGHLEGQRQARDDGMFGSKRGFKRWLTAQDERTCPTCRPMDGIKVGMDQKFSVTIYRETKGGVKGVGRVEIDSPPVHPNCRCTTLLELE